ncbi:two-component system sensor histidine kinase NtrB [Gilvimarinus sp. F26214L]|uniref:two-component system sensor histidine kinase NtrB n=1 Tax=Gilvimarinus sp. DZF01 TaxID=3461371 RepID=UPI004045385D
MAILARRESLQWRLTPNPRRSRMPSTAESATPDGSRRIARLRHAPALAFAVLALTLSVPAALAQSPRPGAEEPALAQQEPLEEDERNYLLGIIVALLVLQTALIIGLQHSRIRYKHAKENLKRSQRALEERVIERTNRLRTINNQLYEEIARHELTEERLQETQNYLQSVVDSMPSVLIGVTREGTITHWNSAAEGATDISADKAIGRNLNDVSPDLNVDMEMIRNAIDQGVAQAKEAIRHEFGGQVGYTDLVIYPLMAEDMTGAVIRIDDVTMRVRFENMMIQNEKMMSLGELAAGMAHEINNPLSAILHAVQNVYRRTSPELPANVEAAKKVGISTEQLQAYLQARGIYQFIDSIKEAGERSASIVTNMLEFSRSNSRGHELVELVELLEQSLELSHQSFDLRTAQGGKPVRIFKEFQPDLPRVPCSPAEIQQVILNILRNAAQAFVKSDGDKGPPSITLRAFRENGMVKIQVEDNGPGMSEATRRHIFEPFYTTKEVGKGTGLGLSVSYFIVTEHHSGQIEVDSTEGRGTVFTISLPLTEGDSLREGSPTRLA